MQKTSLKLEISCFEWICPRYTSRFLVSVLESANVNPSSKQFIIHEENKKEILAVKKSLYLIKINVDFHKTFALIFSASATSVLKVSL